MSYYSRLQKAFEGAPRLPLNAYSKYVIFSDCHRGIGNANDNFLKNQTLYKAALTHYLNEGFTYLELGDGDELWENYDLQKIIEAHSDVFELQAEFHRRERLYLIYGNHDIVKRNANFTSGCFHEGIILENSLSNSAFHIYLTHGHQAELLNSTFWPVARFLVRYAWKPLESFGVLNPTSAAENNTRKAKIEKHLRDFGERNGVLLIAGHTHRALLSDTDPYYCNSGSCVRPYSITCLEISHMQIRLIKWSLNADEAMRLYVSRTLLSGPFTLER